MSKAIIVGVTTFVILCVGSYVVLSNSHIDIFPGIETTRDFSEDSDTGELVKKETMISLLDASRGTSPDGEGARLTTGGYVVAVLVVLALPLVLGVIAFWVILTVTGPKPDVPAGPAESARDA